MRDSIGSESIFVLERATRYAMGEWKISLTLRVRLETRQEMDAFAAREQRL
jgi:hypothetical protein